MTIIAAIAEFFGISILRLAIYSAIVVAVTTGALTIRQHYIDKGYNSALAAVKNQNDTSKAAAEKVEQKTSSCVDQSYWDVITQGCKLDSAP